MDRSSEPASPRSKRPWYSPVALFQRLIIYLVVGYLALCAYLYFSQNEIEYPRRASGSILPTAEAIRQAQGYHLIPWDKTTPGAAAPQGYVRPYFAESAPRGTIVLFHGNGGWAETRDGYDDVFHARGFRTFFYEYPGYGGRPGRPSEDVIVPDARALIRSLEQEGDGPIYVWGESLGAGVAAAVCADPTLPVHGLVVLTPWDTLAQVGLSRYPFVPVQLLLHDRYDSIANLQHFAHPICEVMSSRDEIIPPALGENLYAHLPAPKHLIVQEGYGHTDWPSSASLPWWDEALDFIAPR
jgi:pimeloyl-ACP methyl ester carboxylesterase